jgi:hypothetical protein
VIWRLDLVIEIDGLIDALIDDVRRAAAQLLRKQ